MTNFYFTRTADAPFDGKYLVSGVVEAPDEDGAIAKLDAALRHANSRDSAQFFHFQSLDDASRANAHGLLVITSCEVA